VAENHAKDRSGLGADCHSNSDLTRAPRSGVCDEPVQADQRERDRIKALAARLSTASVDVDAIYEMLETGFDGLVTAALAASITF